MESQVKVVGILYIIMNGLTLFACVIALIVMAVIGVAGGAAALSEQGSEEAAVVAGVFSVLGLLIGCMALVFSLPGLIAGIGLLKFRPWARILAIVLAVLNLLNFPLGTALGIYALVVLLKTETIQLFEGPRVVPPPIA